MKCNVLFEVRTGFVNTDNEGESSPCITKIIMGFIFAIQSSSTDSFIVLMDRNTTSQ
jgi:hypothetical protein